MHVLTTAEHIKLSQKGCRTINQVTDKAIYMQSYYLVGYILPWLRFSSQFFHQFHLHSQVLQLWLFNVGLRCGRISTWIWYDRYEPSVTGILHGWLQQSTALSMWNQILCVWIKQLMQLHAVTYREAIIQFFQHCLFYVLYLVIVISRYSTDLLNVHLDEWSRGKCWRW